MQDKPLILFLANTTHHTGAVADHINAVITSNEFEWIVENPLNCRILHKYDLSQFDAIGIHYSIRPHQVYYFPKLLLKKLENYQGIKFIFLQDEYRDVDAAQAVMNKLKINIFFTLVEPEFYQKAYPKLDLTSMKLVTVLTGYVPEQLMHINPKPLAQRKTDVFYRGREYEFWLGKLTYEKTQIVKGIQYYADKYQLHIDVSLNENDRLYGEAWQNALQNSRAVLATESGTSIWDYDGSIERKTKQYIGKHPQANFEEVFEHVLKPYDGVLPYKAISPRVFEAIATRTALIMFPGDYNHIVYPEKHYICLAHDFSNIEEVVEKLRDSQYVEALTKNAYDDIIKSKNFHGQQLANIISRELKILHIKKRTLLNPHSLNQDLAKFKTQHKLLNWFFILYNELNFGVTNILNILKDPRFSFTIKLKKILGGTKRYWNYLIPRMYLKKVFKYQDS